MLRGKYPFSTETPTLGYPLINKTTLHVMTSYFKETLDQKKYLSRGIHVKVYKMISHCLLLLQLYLIFQFNHAAFD